MTQPHDEAEWLQQVIEQQDSFESAAVAEFANRVLSQAKRELPRYLSSRVDPEDIVQSVFRSFFQRHRSSPFSFETANDVWRLLSAMTYKKVCNKIRHHHRKLRDVNREGTADVAHLPATNGNDASASAVTIMMELLQRIVQQIPPQHQEILMLRMNDCTIEEIAEQLQISSRTVDRALQRVRHICNDIHSLE
jgi:RNA polymerase sigma-70 factor (ECF subfamily)